ncbi:COP9 signalosome (CSN) subunit [Geranomyces variabilis]|uniref:COP9 signalosome (CSN) subunit n=1 Tax=Geranomyces variabilis TaxID=109894 RepID=A0AAD5TEM6_9FUNG|nr:COP9 signalosome (CSN) subunit [Geranomyces variabilis]
MNNQETVQAYLSRVSAAIGAGNGPELASLLRLDGPHSAELHQVTRMVKAGVVESSVRRNLDETWSDVVWGHIRVLRLVKTLSHTSRGGRERFEGEIAAAAELQNTVVQTFHQVFSTHTRWCLPVLYAVNGDLRSLSIEADALLRSRGEKAGNLEEAARTMNKAFSYCVTDRFSPPDKSRKWGTYHVVNLLFKTYFRLTQTNLCSSVLRSLSAGDLPALERFPIADQLTFKFHVGVLAFYNEQYTKAEQDLSFALQHCPRNDAEESPLSHGLQINKLLILNFLVPTRMILGVLPRPELLQKYPALEYLYGYFVTAIRTGDIRLFDESLQRLQRDLIERGTYLTVERARALAARMLFKKVWLVHDGSSRIPMQQFQRAMHLAGSDSSMDSVACMLANMIDKGYLKGYLSHEKQMVVTGKEPFPNIKAVPM